MRVSSSKAELFCFQDFWYITNTTLNQLEYFYPGQYQFLMWNFFSGGKKDFKKTRKTAAKYKAYHKLSTGLNHYFLHRPVKFICISTTVTYDLLGVLDILSKAQLKKQNRNQTAKHDLAQISSQERIMPDSKRMHIVRKTVMSTCCFFKSLVHLKKKKIRKK